MISIHENIVRQEKGGNNETAVKKKGREVKGGRITRLTLSYILILLTKLILNQLFVFVMLTISNSLHPKYYKIIHVSIFPCVFPPSLCSLVIVPVCDHGQLGQSPKKMGNR